MHQYTIDSGDYSSLSTARTILQLVTGSTRRARLKEFGISFASVTATDAPVLVELGTETSAGTSSAFTPRPTDPTDPASISTALNTFSGTEPTGFALAGPGPWRVTPIGGLFVYQFPEGEELVVAVSTRLAMRLTAPQAQSSVRGYFIFQE